MPIRTGTALDHVALFDELLSFLQSDSDGPSWTLLRENSAGDSALFMAPGLAATDEIYIGVNLTADAGADTFAIGFWMFKDYNAALEDDEQPGASIVCYMPVWDDAMPFWFVANGQRLIVTAKVSTVYTAAYAGKFFPDGLPSEYPMPYYVGSCATAASTRWSSTSESVRNPWDPGLAARVLLPSGQWRTVCNFYDDAGAERGNTDSHYIWPFYSGISGSGVRTRYRELRENLDGSYSLLPLILHGDNPQSDMLGALDGVYAVPAFSAATEDTVTVSGVQHLLVQNVYRTARYYYGAIALE